MIISGRMKSEVSSDRKEQNRDFIRLNRMKEATSAECETSTADKIASNKLK